MDKKIKLSVYFQEYKISNKIVYYQILVNDIVQQQTKVISARYSEIREVFKQLSPSIQQQFLFPKKNFKPCTDLTTSFIEYRKKALQLFINNLLKYCSESEAKPFINFLVKSPSIKSDKLKNEAKATQIPSIDFQQSQQQYEEIKTTPVNYNKNSQKMGDASKYKSEDDLSSILGNSQYQISNPSVFQAQPKLLNEKLNAVVLESNQQFVNINSNQDEFDEEDYTTKKNKYDQILKKIKTLHKDSFMRSRYKFGMIYSGIDKNILLAKSLATKNQKFIKQMDESLQFLINNNCKNVLPNINIIQEHSQKF